MKRSIFAVALVALGACADGAPTSVAPSDEQPQRPAIAGDVIPGQYIVTLAGPTAGDDAAAGAAIVEEVKTTAEEMVTRRGGQLKHVYTSALRGFAATLSEQAVEELRHDPRVTMIEQDQVVTIDATQSGATWGIDRVDQRSLPLSGTYTYTNTASNVRVYVIDTGILTGHTEFGGRASNVYDAFGGNGQDCNGHGTHVSGTVGGAKYGIAKSVMLRGVRVFQCSGSSATSTIIAGIDWVRLNHIKPAVANLSLGGGYSSSMNTAVVNLANSGVFVAVAAGNSNADACNTSPASATSVMTVASSTSSDAKSSFSNWGTCVDLYAPGSSITSAWYTSTTATNTISGTSMATPHVAGVAALYKGTYGDASQSTINSWLINNSTTGKITGNVSGTPNRLLYKSTL